MKTIMTAGKGGTGKSVMLANLLTRHLLPHSPEDILIVDADPHQSLTQLLAAHYNFTIPMSLGELRHKHEDALRSGKGLEQESRRDLAELIIQQALVSLPGGSLLVMGDNDQTGCQCVVNTLLGKSLDALRDCFHLAVVDNEAGIEQIGRHTWPVDILLLMTTPRALDLDVARRILNHAHAVQRNIRHSMLIVNRHQIQFDGNNEQNLLPETNFMLTLPYAKSLDERDVPDLNWLVSLQVLWSAIQRQGI